MIECENFDKNTPFSILGMILIYYVRLNLLVTRLKEALGILFLNILETLFSIDFRLRIETFENEVRKK